MRVAVPPDDGSVQMLPCRSMARVRPSGDTVTAIEVPSWTVTSISAGFGTGAAPSAAQRTSTPIAIVLPVIRGLLSDAAYSNRADSR